MELSQKTLSTCIGAATVYGLSVYLCKTASFEPVRLAIVWPPSGIGLAAYLLVTKKNWGLLALCMVAANTAANLFVLRPLILLPGVVCTSLNMLVTAYLYERLAGSETCLRDARRMISFIVASIAGSVLGGLTVGANRSFLDEGPFSDFFWQYLISGINGSVFVGGFLIEVAHTIRTRVFEYGGRAIECTALVALLMSTIALVFTVTGLRTEFLPSFPFIPLPLIFWAVFRYGALGGLFSMISLRIGTIWGTLASKGPFVVGDSLQHNLEGAQFYLCIMALTTISLSALRGEIKKFHGKMIASELEARSLATKLSLIPETMMDGFAYLSRSELFLSANHSLSQMIGYSIEELKTLRMCDISCRQPNDGPQVAFDIAEPGNHRFRSALRRKDGTLVPVELSSCRIPGQDDWFTIIRDITLQVEHETSVEQRKRDLEETVNQRTLELRNLAQRMNSVREETCRKISREIHDDLGQCLAGVKISLEVGLKRLSRNPNIGEIKERLEEASSTINQTLRSLRRIASELRPVILDEFGLQEALMWLCAQFGRQTGIHCSADLGSSALEIPPSNVAIALFRIVQEALANVARHAAATSASVRLWANLDVLCLEVHDNGVGIDFERSPRRRDGLGLISMRERALELGGSVTVNKADEGGTVVAASMPLARLREIRCYDSSPCHR